ncbi:MAG: ABC transporter permease [Simkania sp.]|nr:ABC transporter permease [Simkania sp.]
MHSIPGDPLLQEQAVPEEIMRSLYKYYGLDQPWYIQYLRYLKGIVTWDLGPSFKYEGRTVNQIISSGFPVSFCLGSMALFIAISVGITLGMISAWHRNHWQDHVAALVSVIGISVPSFLIATLLQYLFCIKLQLLPVARWGSFSHTLLPALSMAALPTAFIARLTRSSMVEILQQDYILTARSKGLSSIRLMLRHVMRNALLPVVTYIGPLTASILTGSFVIEKIFAIPGLGYWFVMSVSNRDYTVILGVTVFYSCLLMCCIFLVDIFYAFLDPRIRTAFRR